MGVGVEERLQNAAHTGSEREEGGLMETYLLDLSLRRTWQKAREEARPAWSQQELFPEVKQQDVQPIERNDPKLFQIWVGSISAFHLPRDLQHLFFPGALVSPPVKWVNWTNARLLDYFLI